MAVDWGMAVFDPSRSIKQGSDYVNQLYDQAARMDAGRKFAAGDYQGASAAVAGRGDIQGATQIRDYSQKQDTIKARKTAGAKFGSGDYAGAAQDLANSGDLQDATAVSQYGQTEADKKAAAFTKQHQYLQQAVPVFQGILQKAGPEAVAQAFEQIVPDLQSMGTDPAQIEQIRQSMKANPEQTLQILGATAQKKFSVQKTDDGSIIAFDENNPSAPPLTIYQGQDAKPPTTRTVINGDQTQTEQWNPKTKQFEAIGKPGARFRPAEDGPAPDDEAIKNDVRIWLASKGTINPQYGQGKTGAAARQMFDTQKNSVMKELGVTPEDVASGRASRVADQSSLSQLTKLQGNVRAFENTARNSIKLALGLLSKGGAQGQSPIINRWIQAGRRSILGDPDVAVFNNHLDTVADEYAKIMGGGTGASASTDAARADAHSRINKADNAETLRRVLDGLQQEMDGRTNSIAGEIDAVNGRLRGYGGTGGAPPSKPDPLGLR